MTSMKTIDLSSVDLNLLVAFESIYKTRSVTGAAKQLHVGQPAMSAALSRLRLLFKDDLFVRVGRDMQPTVVAREVAPGVASALEQIRLTLQASQHFDPATAELAFVIGSSDYASVVIIPRLLQICRETAPYVDFRLISYEKDQIDSLLNKNRTTIVLGSSFQNLSQHLREQSLMEERFIGICRKGHPDVFDGNLPLERFVALPHALLTLQHDASGVIDQALDELSEGRRIVLTTPYWLTLPAIIADSDMVAALPFRLARQFAAQGLVDLFEIPLDIKSWSISMVWSELSAQSSSCHWLRQTIRQICKEI